MFRNTIILFLILFCFNVFVVATTKAMDMEHTSGRILLQVEENGEAWYVSPNKLDRYFLGRPSDAFALMREKGVGISNLDLEKIPVGLGVSSGQDLDLDGISDELERAIKTDFNNKDTDGDGIIDFEEIEHGYDPRSKEKLIFDPAFIARNVGRIFLQVESRGEAWYIYPVDGKRYFLGRPQDAYEIMRKLGLGITNNDLEKLIAMTPSFNLENFEERVHVLINEERIKEGLAPVKMNKDISQVAKDHSLSLAVENKQVSGIGIYCSFSLIHHEGLESNTYNSDRLAKAGVKYYVRTGENIHGNPTAITNFVYYEDEVSAGYFDNCDEIARTRSADLKTYLYDKTKTKEEKFVYIRNELAERKEIFEDSQKFEVSEIAWSSSEELAQETVSGWMNSPGHRNNILTKEYDEAGVGAAYVNTYLIVTQIFIERTDCGYEGAKCCPGYACQLPTTCQADICSLPEQE